MHHRLSFNLPGTLVFGSYKFSEARQEKANTLLTRFIVSNMLPLSLVDNEAFVEFVNFLDREYRIPCRQTLTARLDGIKMERAKTLKMPGVSLMDGTTDIWTSYNYEPYVSFTLPVRRTGSSSEELSAIL